MRRLTVAGAVGVLGDGRLADADALPAAPPELKSVERVRRLFEGKGGVHVVEFALRDEGGRSLCS